MRLRTLVNLGSLGAIGGFGLLVSCTPDQALTPPVAGPNLKKDDNAGHVLFGNYSVTPALVKNVMSGMQVYSLLSSDDTLKGSPKFVFGGTADGAARCEWKRVLDGDCERSQHQWESVRCD